MLLFDATEFWRGFSFGDRSYADGSVLGEVFKALEGPVFVGEVDAPSALALHLLPAARAGLGSQPVCVEDGCGRFGVRLLVVHR